MAYTAEETSAASTDEQQDRETRLPGDVAALLQKTYQLDVGEVQAEIDGWLRELVPNCINANVQRNEDKRKKYRKTLAGERSVPPMRPDTSNLSVPLSIWAAAAVRARVSEALVESTPLLSCTPLPARTPEGIDLNAAAKHLVTFFEAEFRNPRALNGKITTLKAAKETVNLGTSGMKVYLQADMPKRVPVWGSEETIDVVVKGRPKWAHICGDDLIYVDGYGNDTQAMPLVGHRVPMAWSQMRMYEALGWFREGALERVKSFYESKPDQRDKVAAFREHTVAELYFDYAVPNAKGKIDGVPSPLCVFWHIEAGQCLGLTYNYIPGGVRPIWITQFDESPDSSLAEGQGVMEKLDGAQDETDEIHNLGIEAVKRAIAHIIALRQGTGAARDFGGGTPLLPGDRTVTETPKDDVVPIKLGDMQGLEAAQFQERSTRGYVTSMLGLDESAIGNVESGKRVPASLGMATMREGRAIIKHALTTFSAALTDMVYVTLDLYRLRLPEDTLNAALDPDAVAVLRGAAFAAADVDLRSRFVLNFSAQDAATSQEAKKQELLLIGQFLQGYYSQLVQLGQQALMVPEPLREAMIMVLEKQRNAAAALLNTVESIQNPDDVLPDVARVAEALRAAGSAMSAGAGAPGGGGGGGGMMGGQGGMI